jgi:superfamily II DNA/RNA helicase
MKCIDQCTGSFLFFSATWPEDVRRIAARYMRNPIQIYIGTLDLAVCLLCIYLFYYIYKFTFLLGCT